MRKTSLKWLFLLKESQVDEHTDAGAEENGDDDGHDRAKP